ncbi:protein naked cuticle homolog 2 [Lampetra fluviatilis]
MGKFQSKQACRRRESPEGDSFVVNAYANRRGLEEVTASVLPPAYRRAASHGLGDLDGRRRLAPVAPFDDFSSDLSKRL